jgi:hypothetical protein
MTDPSMLPAEIVTPDGAVAGASVVTAEDSLVVLGLAVLVCCCGDAQPAMTANKAMNK